MSGGRTEVTGKMGLVVATNRSVDFLEEWIPHLSEDVVLYIVEDRPERSLALPGGPHRKRHYAWSDIDTDLGGKSWIIPRQTSGIKSYGFFKAWQEGCEIIGCLDDDCYPAETDWEETHRRILGSRVPLAEECFNTVFGFYPRGFPFSARQDERPVVLNVGGWLECPDLDARTELELGVPAVWWLADAIVPYGAYFPMCGMNIAFRREITPIMYFGLQGRGYPYDRYDDIWCGLFAKAVIDGMGSAVHVGRPAVRHVRASNPRENLRKEASGYDVTEKLYTGRLFRCLPCRSWLEGMIRVSMRLNAMNGPGYFDKLGEAMRAWAMLFADKEKGLRACA